MTQNVPKIVGMELFANALVSIADEMALAIYRTAYSGVLKENMDYSTAVADADGQLLAQGLTMPGHLGAIPTALEAIFRKYNGNIVDGDIFVLNDPFDGGMHLPDIFLFRPIFFKGTLLVFAVTVCHHVDVGGRVPGSNAADSVEIFQEGLRIPPSRLYQAGEANETLFSLIERNVRLPNALFADLRAQLSACSVAQSRILELAEELGPDDFRAFSSELLDYSERLTRTALEELPDGIFSFEDFIDDDGIDREKPIRIHVTLQKQGGHIRADWSGCAPQVRGAINNTLSFTNAATYTAIKAFLPKDIPSNSGVFRAIEVVAKPGTIADAVLPAAVAARGLTGFRMVDCCLGALASMVPERSVAAGDGGNTGISIGGYDEQRRPFIFVDFSCSAWGGRAWADGLDGNANLFANIACQSAEVTEAELPIRILANEFVSDRAGAGKFRGGCSIRRDYEILETEAILQVRSDRRDIRPYGLFGGHRGAPSRNMLIRNGEMIDLPSKVTSTAFRGDIFRHELAGGGGWGDPLERDPDAVLDDVVNELVSRDVAERDYGVVLRPDGLSVDRAATQKRRLKNATERPR